MSCTTMTAGGMGFGRSGHGVQCCWGLRIKRELIEGVIYERVAMCCTMVTAGGAGDGRYGGGCTAWVSKRLM